MEQDRIDTDTTTWKDRAMSKQAQRERGISHRDDREASDNGDTSGSAGRVEVTNEPVEAEAVDDVTPTKEPEAETTEEVDLRDA